MMIYHFNIERICDPHLPTETVIHYREGIGSVLWGIQSYELATFRVSEDIAYLKITPSTSAHSL